MNQLFEVLSFSVNGIMYLIEPILQFSKIPTEIVHSWKLSPTLCTLYKTR